MKLTRRGIKQILFLNEDGTYEVVQALNTIVNLEVHDEPKPEPQPEPAPVPQIAVWPDQLRPADDFTRQVCSLAKRHRLSLEAALVFCSAIFDNFEANDVRRDLEQRKKKHGYNYRDLTYAEIQFQIHSLRRAGLLTRHGSNLLPPGALRQSAENKEDVNAVWEALR